MAINEVFAARLKQRMEEKGLTADDLLTARGLGPFRARKLLEGDWKGCNLWSLAGLLDCDIKWLLDGTDAPEPQKPVWDDPSAPYRRLREWLTTTAPMDCPAEMEMVGWMGFQNFSHAMRQEINALQTQDFRALVGWLRRRGIPAPKVVDLEARRRLRVVGK